MTTACFASNAVALEQQSEPYPMVRCVHRIASRASEPVDTDHDSGLVLPSDQRQDVCNVPPIRMAAKKKRPQCGRFGSNNQLMALSRHRLSLRLQTLLELLQNRGIF